jgi:hypothetical protein
MKSTLPLLLAGLGGLLFVSSSSKPSAKKSVSKKPPAEDPYEEFPPDVNVKINEENIYNYFSKDPVWLKNIPDIWNDLNPNLIEYYTNWNTEKSFIKINPVFAVKVYNYAKVLLLNNSQKYTAKTTKEAEVLTKEILLKFAPDIYWKEGLIPYVYQSAFYYVWVSVTFLVKLAWVDINGLSETFAPSEIG